MPVPGHTSWSAEQLKAHCPHQAEQLKSAVNAAEALRQLQAEGWPPTAPVIAGSLYLIGQLMETGLVQAE